jgi:anti-sigma regulatory factor (Ser/Thr protein kinase)
MIAMSCHISESDIESAGTATRMLKEQLAKIGLDASVLRRAMIAAYEAEMNVVIHARTGTLWARLDDGRLDLEVSDEGPGIPDVELAMREGWSTASERARQMGFGAGMGLPNIRKNSDLFEIETREGKGTRIRSTIFLRRDETPQEAAEHQKAFLSVDVGRCRSCHRCIIACPTLALRVRDDGPVLMDHLCIGCAVCFGECLDGVFSIDDGRVPPERMTVVPRDAVLLVPRAFLCGFPGSLSPGRILSALRQLGFSEVRLAEEWSHALRRETRVRLFAGAGMAPLIPPLCPAVVALVESRFPSLIPQMVPFLSPVEAASEEFPLRPVVLAVSCPSQFAAVNRSSITGRLTIVSPARLAAAIHPFLSAHQPGKDEIRIMDVPEPARTKDELVVSGARRVLRALSEAEAGALEETSLLELFMCEGGCDGSPYLSANPFLSLQRWQRAVETSMNAESEGRQRAVADKTDAPGAASEGQTAVGAIRRQRPFTPRPGVRLDPDMAEAIRKLSRIDALKSTLPGRDCAECGSPTCASFAEDVVMGRAAEGGCPHAGEHRSGRSEGKK